MMLLQGQRTTVHKCILHLLGLEAVPGGILLLPQRVSTRGVSSAHTPVIQTTWLTQNHLELRLGHIVLQGKGWSLKNMVRRRDLLTNTGIQRDVLPNTPTFGTKLIQHSNAQTNMEIPI